MHAHRRPLRRTGEPAEAGSGAFAEVAPRDGISGARAAHAAAAVSATGDRGLIQLFIVLVVVTAALIGLSTIDLRPEDGGRAMQLIRR